MGNNLLFIELDENLVIINRNRIFFLCCKWLTTVSFGLVSVLKLQFSTKTELTAKPTNKAGLPNRLQNYYYNFIMPILQFLEKRKIT
jgi:hypothetical protein